MGDRVLFQVINSKTKDFGPIVYAHWSGHRAKEVVKSLQKRIGDAGIDVSYTTARLVQELIGNEEGAMGFGVDSADEMLTAEHSHGDAGVVLIDISRRCEAQYCGGYLSND